MIVKKFSFFLAHLFVLTALPVYAIGSIPAYPDSIDNADVQVYYQLDYKQTNEDTLLSKEIVRLLIGSDVSYCASGHQRYLWDRLPAKTREATNRSHETARMASKMVMQESEKYKTFDCAVYKNYPEVGQMTCCQHVGLDGMGGQNDYMFFVESMPSFEWVLEDGDSIVCTYACQRAATSFRGRHWTVWFAPELSWQDGPWKLCGLPGLILKATDDTGSFCFEAIEISKPKNNFSMISKPGRSYVRTSPKRITELLNLKYGNPEALARLLNGEVIMNQYLQMGMRFDKGNRTPCLLEKFE